MNRIYHPYWLWEDYHFGMYGKPLKRDLSNKVIECLGNEKNCKKYMLKVIEEWKYTCEYHLTNTSINRVAWLGQATMCLYAGLKEQETRNAWWILNEDQRLKANEIAKEVINEWEIKNGKENVRC